MIAAGSVKSNRELPRSRGRPCGLFTVATRPTLGFGSRLCENSDVELVRRKFVSIGLNKKRTALAVTVEGRKERKQFCAFSLEKDAPASRAVERAGQILCRPILGGLHHQFVRI